ncbi:MAG: flagellar type III secretion system pore protein FliP, partial [Planctomycetota bacterium]
ISGCRWLSLLLLALAVLLPARLATAQQQEVSEAPAPAEKPDEPANSLPSVGDLIDVVDKSTSDAESEDAREWSAPVKLALVFAGLAVLPSLVVMVTSFTRIVIVLSFVRRALTTQTIPPNMAVIGLSLFLTLFTMSPTLTAINNSAIQPYLANELEFPQAIEQGQVGIKRFILRQTRRADLELFAGMAKMQELPTTAERVPAHVAVPAFAISEFRTAFEMGCLLFIPFLLVDLVVAGVLLSTGMMMLPPAMVSMPLKIILFVLVDGWGLLAQTLVSSYV